jgi:hypothetical protein
MASDKEGVYGCLVGLAILFIGIAIWEVATAFAIVILYVGLAAGLVYTGVYAYSKIAETEIIKKQAELDLKIKAKELGLTSKQLDLSTNENAIKTKERIILPKTDDDYIDFQELK